MQDLHNMLALEGKEYIWHKHDGMLTSSKHGMNRYVIYSFTLVCPFCLVYRNVKHKHTISLHATVWWASFSRLVNMIQTLICEERLWWYKQSRHWWTTDQRIYIVRLSSWSLVHGKEGWKINYKNETTEFCMHQLLDVANMRTEITC
jgi:hypothetical protein